MAAEDLIDKMVIDNSGNIIGKCLDLRDREEDENLLIVQINSKEKGETTIDVPMSTIQAIGKTIVLAVEIEGLVEDQEVLPYDDELDTDEKVTKQIDDTSKQVEEEHKSQQWILYKSIKIDK